MPAPYGVTPTGFVAKTLTEARAELEEDFRGTFGASIDVSPETSFFGGLIGIFAERMAELWDAAEAVHSAFNPTEATGASLVGVAAITGTVPIAQRRSTVTGTATGTPGTVLAAGRVVSVVGTGVRFRSTATVTIGGGGTVAVPMESEEFGPVIAVAGQLTSIETPVGGWAAFTNPLDADLGTLPETDAELRTRRVDELASQGAGVVASIRARLLQVEGVQSAEVFENITDVTESTGLPPHSIEALVLGGEPAAIAAAILETKPAGIRSHGATSATATDSEGNVWTLRFTRPTPVPIWMRLVLHVEPTEFPVSGIAQAQAALVAHGDTYAAGQDVKRSQFYGPVMAIPGVVDLRFFSMGTTQAVGHSVENRHLTITSRQLATFDTSRILVSSTTVSEDSEALT